MNEKKEKGKSVFIILAIIFVIIYIILAARPLGKEYQLNPEWKINISTPTTEPAASEELIPFKLGQSLGYFTNSGKLSLYSSFPAKAAISSDYYCSYSTNSENIVFYDNQGNDLGTLKQEGFPLFNDNRIYVFLPGGSSFSKCDSTGAVLWSAESVMPITAFSSTENHTASGYANGSIKIIDNNTGATALSYSPGGSDYPVILGLDISTNGTYIASVSGHNKQRFTLAKNEDNQPKIIYHYFLDSEVQDRTFVKFTKDNTRVLYNCNNGIGIYNIEKNKNTIVPADKRIIDMAETENLIFLLGKNHHAYTVYLIQKTDILEGSFSFTADTAFIKTLNNDVYIGKDNTISKINLKKE